RISNRRRPVAASERSSSTVSRSISTVASPASRSERATNRLRGLCRLLPDPCAKRTTPRRPSGDSSAPSSTADPAAIPTGRRAEAGGDIRQVGQDRPGGRDEEDREVRFDERDRPVQKIGG